MANADRSLCPALIAISAPTSKDSPCCNSYTWQFIPNALTRTDTEPPKIIRSSGLTFSVVAVTVFTADIPSLASLSSFAGFTEFTEVAEVAVGGSPPLAPSLLTLLSLLLALAVLVALLVAVLVLRLVLRWGERWLLGLLFGAFSDSSS